MKTCSGDIKLGHAALIGLKHNNNYIGKVNEAIGTETAIQKRMINAIFLQTMEAGQTDPGARRYILLSTPLQYSQDGYLEADS